MENAGFTTTIEVDIDNEEKAAVVAAILANLDIYQQEQDTTTDDKE